MAIDDAYATVAAYKAGPQTRRMSGTDDPDIGEDLQAISRYMDRKLHQPSGFNKDVAAVVRYYRTMGSPRMGGIPENWAETENPWRYVKGQNTLYVDNIADPTGMIVRIDQNRSGVYDTTVTPAQYQLWPRNAAVGPEPKPYNALFLPPYSTFSLLWTPYCDVEITAIWGWPSVPKAIERACIQLTGILRMDSPRATRLVTAVDNVMDTSYEAQNIIKELMMAYTKVGRV